MENVTTKEKYTFKCGRWLAVDEDDHSTVREMPAEGPLVKKPLACKFYIQTYTYQYQYFFRTVNHILLLYASIFIHKLWVVYNTMITNTSFSEKPDFVVFFFSGEVHSWGLHGEEIGCWNRRQRVSVYIWRAWRHWQTSPDQFIH